ncbi:hypothetical protein [Streptomyces sp. NPDC046942]|uniref:hypothetical protein n=1 Tax=Streptomyces sp. NPDC046942 TaxID=3155137 RepID=UPI0033E4F33F
MSSASPGRPVIGPKVPINFPESLLRNIEQAADTAGLSRAAWVRRTVSRALPESFEGPVGPDQMLRFLRGSETDKGIDTTDPEPAGVYVDNDTARLLLRAVDDGTLTASPVITESLAVESTRARRSISFITRTFRTSRDPVTIYQVTFTTVSHPQPGESEGGQHCARRLYLDQDAARAFYDEARELHLKVS